MSEEIQEFAECRTDAYTEEYDGGNLARVRVEVRWVDGKRIHYERDGEQRIDEETDDEVAVELLFERTDTKRIELCGFYCLGTNTGDRLKREHLRALRTFTYGRDVVDERTDPSFTVEVTRLTLDKHLNA